MSSEKLDLAIQLIEAGNKQAAVPVLREIIKENARDENAWLLLYDCMDQVEHKKFCLQSVLTINPENHVAREALDALTTPAPVPAPVEFTWSQPEDVAPPAAQPKDTEPVPMVWDEPEADQLAWDDTETKKTEPEPMRWDEPEASEVAWQKFEPQKMLWEQADTDQLEQEQLEREKNEQKRLEREKAELQRVESLKMEWERAESNRVEREKVVRKTVEPERDESLKMEWEQDEPEKRQPPKIEWDDWDEAEPASVRPLKQKTVKVSAKTTPRRKPHSRRRSLFPFIAGLVLFVMLFTVCLVFMAQIVAPIP